jgi:hypothetical protein
VYLDVAARANMIGAEVANNLRAVGFYRDSLLLVFAKAGLARYKNWTGKEVLWEEIKDHQHDLDGDERAFSLILVRTDCRGGEDRLRWLWWHALSRSSQRCRISLDRLNRFIDKWIPVPRALHPHPMQRFDATHPRREPYA